MNQFLNKRTTLLIITAVTLSTLLNGGLRLLNVSLSPTELIFRNLILGLNILQIGLLVFIVMQLIAQFSAQKSNDVTKPFILACAVYIAVGFLSISLADTLSPPIKARGYQAFLAENIFLLDAIELYEAEQGHPPANLEALYPTYLTSPFASLQTEQVGDIERPKLEISFPYTSLDAASAGQVAYDYQFPADPDTDESQQWELSVSIYLGSFKSVRFIYNPTQQYDPDHGRLSNWAYTGAYD